MQLIQLEKTKKMIIIKSIPETSANKFYDNDHSSIFPGITILRVSCNVYMYVCLAINCCEIRNARVVQRLMWNSEIAIPKVRESSASCDTCIKKLLNAS